MANRLPVSGVTQDRTYIPVPDGSAVRPPFQLRAISMLYLSGHWRSAPALPDLPPGLTPRPDRTGVIGLYHAAEGRGLAPLTVFFFGLDVAQTHAADGSPAVFLLDGRADGRGAPVFERYLSSTYLPGKAELSMTDDHWTGRVDLGGPGQGLRLALRAHPDRQMSDSDTNYYIGTLGGQPNGFSVTYSNTYQLADLTQMHLDVPDGHPWSFLRHFTLDYALACTDQNMTYSPPYPLDLSGQPDQPAAARREGDAAASVALDILGRIGRAVVLIDDRGRILYSNSQGEAVLAGLAHSPPSQLVLPPPARGPGSAAPKAGLRLALTRMDGRPVFARALPTGLRLSGRNAIMVLLSDPALPGPSDPSDLLRFFGLTPAESRLALRVARGEPPMEAGAALGITRESARTVLKAIFSKLGIGRQSELARLVAQLEGA